MLDNLAVDEGYRGKKISDLLLKNLYNYLRKNKVNYIQVLEEEHHKKTREFWKHQGYKETKQFIWAEKTI